MKILILVHYLTLGILKSFPLQTNGDSDMLQEEKDYIFEKEKDKSKPTFAFVTEPGDKQAAAIYVYHSVEIVDISRVSLETMDFRVDLHLKQRWLQDEKDFPRGLFKENATNEAYITVNADSEHPILRALWTPDAYIPNARITHIASLKESHSSIVLYKNRTVILAARLFVVLGCQMQFHWYPMDIQHCELILESYSYSVKKVIFLWTNISHPVLFSPDIKLLRYAVRLPLGYHEGTDDRFGRDGAVIVKLLYMSMIEKFSRVTVNFIFERQIGHQLIQVFTPTFLIVALSWFSFWLGLDAVPGRVSLVVTCMLTLVTMYSGLKSDLPPVAYIKMLDIWMAGCMGFVFAAMSEFVIVKYISWTHKQETENEELIKLIGSLNSHRLNTKNKSSYPLNMFPSGTERPSIMRITDSRPWNLHADENFDADGYMHSKKWAFRAITKQTEPLSYAALNGHAKKEKYEWERLDRVSRVAFPLVFMVFLCIFWPVLILGANSQK